MRYYDKIYRDTRARKVDNFRFMLRQYLSSYLYWLTRDRIEALKFSWVLHTIHDTARAFARSDSAMLAYLDNVMGALWYVDFSRNECL